MSSSHPELCGVVVGTPDFEMAWSNSVALLDKAIAFSDGKETLENIKRQVERRDMQFWVVVDFSKPPFEILAAFVTRIECHPKKKVLSIPYLGGKEAERWLDNIAIIEDFARSNGCESVEVIGRRGWIKKLPDYEPIHTVIRKVL